MSPQPFSINESAIALHEFWSNLVSAGFTVEQALHLTAHLILGNKGTQA